MKMPKAKDKTKRRRIEEIEVCVNTQLWSLFSEIFENETGMKFDDLMSTRGYFLCRMIFRVSPKDLARGT